ncbi:MAG: ASCH domain-containing protein [Planctomycetota bacterium]|jgi:hypothetical protein
MKAISVRQPWASMIAGGEKTIETRTWQTDYRGPLLIVSSKRPEWGDLPLGQGLCVVQLADCRPMTKEDEPAAGCEIYFDAQAWCLENIRPIEPFAVRGQLGLYEVDDELIRTV